MPKKGAKCFRKPNSFAEQKWDMKKGDLKELGILIDDVLYFMRQLIYKYGNKNKTEMGGDEDDNDNDSNNDDTYNEPNDGSLSNNSDSSDSEIEAPEVYIFHGCTTFGIWGHFVEQQDRLFLFVIHDTSKNIALD